MNTTINNIQELCAAFGAGKEVEFLSSDKVWQSVHMGNIGTSILYFHDRAFRIKLEPEPEPCPGEVAEAMRKFGGSFMSALGLAVHHADANNLQRIKTAFAEDWQKYSEVAKRKMES